MNFLPFRPWHVGTFSSLFPFFLFLQPVVVQARPGEKNMITIIIRGEKISGVANTVNSSISMIALIRERKPFGK